MVSKIVNTLDDHPASGAHGKARGTLLQPEWGDIPAKRWRIHPSRQKPGWLSAAG